MSSKTYTFVKSKGKRPSLRRQAKLLRGASSGQFVAAADAARKPLRETFRRGAWHVERNGLQNAGATTQQLLEAVEKVHREFEALREPLDEIRKFQQYFDSQKTLLVEVNQLDVAVKAMAGTVDIKLIVEVQDVVAAANRVSGAAGLLTEIERAHRQVVVPLERIESIVSEFKLPAMASRDAVPPVSLPLADPSSNRLVLSAAERVMAAHSEVFKALAKQ